MVELSQREGVHVLHLGGGENVMSPAWLEAIDSCLDLACASPAPLITTASGKFYSNGLDLTALNRDSEAGSRYTANVEALLARLLTLPLPTIAAINGHAFGAGGMLAMAHDWRAMRSDRGYLCFPEVLVGVPFTSGTAALVQAKTSAQTARSAMLTGRRYDGPQALSAGMVDFTASEGGLVTVALTHVLPFGGLDFRALGKVKSTMYGSVTAQLLASAPGAPH